MNRQRLLVACLASVLVVFLYSCSSDDDGPTAPVDRDFGAVITDGGEFEVVEERHEVSEETVVDVVGNEDFFCTTRRYSITEAPDDFVLFNPNAEIVWPGNLIQGQSLKNSTPSPIPVRRGPGTVVMTILNGSPSVSRDLPEVSLSAVAGAMNDIVSASPDTLPARFQFSYEEVHSWEHLALALDVSVSYLTNQVGTSLSFSADREYHRYVVKLYQSFFDIAFQIPTRTEDFFHPDETAANLARFVGPGNPPAFISQVTYGRIFYLLIESTASSLDMGASINASFRAGVVGGSLDASATYVSELENVRIKAFALGGNQGEALQAITSDFESLKSFLASGGQVRTGVPLSYVARSLAHPDEIVNVAVAADYEVTQCRPVGASFEHPIFFFRAGKEDPGDPDEPEAIDLVTDGDRQCVSAWHDLHHYETDAHDAVPADGYAMAGEWIEDATATGRPAVRFGPPSVNVGSALRFPGLAFADSSYTVVVVARLGAATGTYPAHFLFGTAPQDRRNLRIGFADESRPTFTTGSQRVDGDAGLSLRDFNVFTFRFSRTEGMTIHLNLWADPLAHDATCTLPLLSYEGARLGTSNGTVMEIAEIQAYGIAFHEAQRRYVAERLRVKYGI